MITMLLGGLWHGAAWNFIIWGAIHGAILILERTGKLLGLSMPGLAGWFLTFSAVSLAWCFFFLDFKDALILISRLATSQQEELPYNTIAIWFYVALLFSDFLARPYRVTNGVIKATSIGIWLSPFALTACFYFAGKPLPFIYFDF